MSYWSHRRSHRRHCRRSHVRTALALSAALVLADAAVPATTPMATAQPAPATRTSAHGQPLCTLEATAADEQLAANLVAAYEGALQAASASVQARYPQHAAAFASAGDLDPSSLLALPAYAAAVSDLALAGYTTADITVIMVGAQHPEKLVAGSVRETLAGGFPDASLTRALELEQSHRAQAGSPRVPLLSEGAEFSITFRTELREHEAELVAARAAYEAELGHAALADAWSACAQDLRAQGATEGMQPVPEVLVPLDPPTAGTGASSASPAAVVVGMVALSLVVVGAAYVVNSPDGVRLPQLKLPALPALPFPLAG